LIANRIFTCKQVLDATTTNKQVDVLLTNTDLQKRGHFSTVGLLFMWIWMYSSLQGYNKRLSVLHNKKCVR